MAAPDQVKVTKTYREDHWDVRVEVLPVTGGVLPPEVFIHENTGKVQLGGYVGVCSKEELQRLRVWAGEVIKKFGNRYIRHNVAEYSLAPGVDPDQSIAIIRQNLANLRSALLSNAEETSVYEVR